MEPDREQIKQFIIDGTCPICGEGTFSNLGIHISQIHGSNKRLRYDFGISTEKPEPMKKRREDDLYELHVRDAKTLYVLDREIRHRTGEDAKITDVLTMTVWELLNAYSFGLGRTVDLYTELYRLWGMGTLQRLLEKRWPEKKWGLYGR